MEFDSVSRKKAGSVRFRKTQSVRFSLSVVKYKKSVSCCVCVCVCVCEFCILDDGFLNVQLVSTDNLISWSFTIYYHLLSDSVRNVKNVKALREWLKYWRFVWDKFGFEKKTRKPKFRVWPFGFGSFFKNRNRTEIQFPHMPNKEPKATSKTSSLKSTPFAIQIPYIHTNISYGQTRDLINWKWDGKNGSTQNLLIMSTSCMTQFT